MIETGHNSIQFTPPSSSLQPLDETVDAAAKRFLIDPPLELRFARTYSDVVAYAKLQLSAAVAHRLGKRA
jgi:hypothetical protein